jgi:hypothetical protein
MIKMAYVPHCTPGTVAGTLIVECRGKNYTTHTNARTGPNVIEVRDSEELIAKFVMTRVLGAGTRVTLFTGIHRPAASRLLYLSLCKTLSYTKPSGLI